MQVTPVYTAWVFPESAVFHKVLGEQCASHGKCPGVHLLDLLDSLFRSDASCQTDRMLRSYHVDKAVISAKGIDMNAGLTDSDDLHANNKRTMLTRAKEKILAVDSSKFDQVAFAEIGSLDQITTIVTDAKPETRWLQHFDKIGVKCIYPK